MDCTRVQELLPLYTGADLAAREAERVLAHLETCAACRDLAEEFAASTAWLQAAPPPEFDEAFFAALRANVQQEIAQTELKPSWFERWLPALNWRWAWVPVLALILLAIALNWQRQRVLPTTQPGKDMVNNEPGPTPELPERERPTSEPNNFAVQQKPRHKQAQGSGRLHNEPKDVAVDVTTTQPRPELTVPEEPPKPNAAAAGTSMLATTQEVTRIEIQTADPNIRIIWLTPKPQDATTPAETPNR